ncbi:MAG: sulfur reduction protein DsrE [Gammaproteobacteria bacterium]|nr:MAG: sulfur reduction protein DsrE [Gammaproteobacteria bacterium]
MPAPDLKEHYLPEGEAKSVVIIMTSGPSTPQRCATPFYIGAILAAMDADVQIFLTMEGVKLAEKRVAETLTAMEGGKRIIEFIRDAKQAGVKLHLCLPALPGYDIDEEADIIEEVDALSGGGVLADLILTCDKVISF